MIKFSKKHFFYKCQTGDPLCQNKKHNISQKLQGGVEFFRVGSQARPQKVFFDDRN